MDSPIGYYDRARFRWYEKPTLLGQKMFHLPVLGWVTVFQFMLLVGVGLLGMFRTMNLGGPLAAVGRLFVCKVPPATTGV